MYACGTEKKKKAVLAIVIKKKKKAVLALRKHMFKSCFCLRLPVLSSTV